MIYCYYDKTGILREIINDIIDKEIIIPKYLFIVKEMILIIFQ